LAKELKQANICLLTFEEKVKVLKRELAEAEVKRQSMQYSYEERRKRLVQRMRNMVG